MAASHAPTASEYIVHHLAHLNTSGHAQTEIVDFSIVNIDTLFYSVLLGALMAWMLRKAALAIRADQVPNRFVGAIESLVEFVHEQARSIVHGDIRYIAPLALTAFIWIVFMNAMDLVPVDLLPRVGELIGIPYMRVVATADLNATMAMSLTVIGASIYYGLKIKKPGGFLHELIVAPFGSSKNPLIAAIMAVVNFVMQIIEYVAKAVSLGMRLFGNMYAGELLFMLIALLGGAFTLSLGGILLGFGHIIAGTAWAIFHILIVLLQGFIFMMLTLVYIGQAHEAH